MQINIEWKMTKYPTFSFALCSKEGADPFLIVHDCRIVDGKNGPFVSFPARKDDQGKYWNYVRAGEKFGAHLLEMAQKAMPSSKPAKPSHSTEDSDIPFKDPLSYRGAHSVL